MPPKITVVVPTRERLPVLKHCLQTLLAQRYKNFEILVSDNCSTDGTAEFVRSANDSRVRYLKTDQRVSMTDNFEFALSQVDGDWVTFLGDDDGLTTNAIADLAEVIETTNCEVISYRACNYVWPVASGSDRGRLTVPLSRGRQTRNSREWLERVMDGRADYSQLPNIYCVGMAKMNLVEKIRRQNGRFFNSQIPDLYAAVALARTTKTYLYVNQAFSVIGSSKFSTGAAFQEEGGAVTGTNEFQRFVQEANIPFHPDIPMGSDGRYPLSLQIHVYEGYLQSGFLDPNGGVATAAPARQLELALARPWLPEKFDKANLSWGREFARRHGLDFDGTLARSRHIRRKDQFTKALQRLRLAWECLLIYDRSLPMENVFAASLVAAAVLWLRPSQVARLLEAWRRLNDRVKSFPKANRGPRQSTFRRMWKEIRGD